MRHVLSVVVYNEPGVLSRVVGLFSGRGFNIHSLNVAPVLDLAPQEEKDESGKVHKVRAEVSHLTIVTTGDAQIMEQIIKQLRKLIPIIKVVDFQDTETVQREMMLIKVNASGHKRGEVLRVADIFRCKVVDVGHADITLEATGNHEKLEAIIGLFKNDIKDIARAGTLALRRSRQKGD